MAHVDSRLITFLAADGSRVASIKPEVITGGRVRTPRAGIPR